MMIQGLWVMWKARKGSWLKETAWWFQRLRGSFTHRKTKAAEALSSEN